MYVRLSGLLPRATSAAVIPLNPAIFCAPLRRDILHLCSTHYLDSIRQGSASTKTRAEVRGSGRKLHPQKGIGAARVGDGQSPIRRGGGVAFGPKPRDFATQLPRKVLEMGMRAALSSKIAMSTFHVVPKMDWPSAKTGTLAERLRKLDWGDSLFVSGDVNLIDEGWRRFMRASGNLKTVETLTTEDLNVYHILKAKRLILDMSAVEWFERHLKPDNPKAAAIPLQTTIPVAPLVTADPNVPIDEITPDELESDEPILGL